LLSVVFEAATRTRKAASGKWNSGTHVITVDWVTIADLADQGRRLSFQRVDDHMAPNWPERLCPQQAYVDLLVDDVDAADGQVVALGARRLADDIVVHEDESFRVYADPAGPPFCLIVQSAPDP
jgi:hypothetical protein